MEKKKKITILFLCAALLLSTVIIAGCNVTSEKTTLMVYMIGSDLESKSGAASGDLTEIEESGVDLNRNNILVYTGGAKAWHNDVSDATENRILSLTTDGWKTEDHLEQTSMGEAETLANFLNYCVKNKPAEHYALILWNHGNGPLIGYGKDSLFNNDTLTLSEMKTALDASSFCNENKLAWVGFDACLMSGAEVAEILSDYADYMVASQEIEPVFGWQYGFLNSLGKTDTVSFLCGITEKYLNTCIEYYEKKGYENKDCTLACIDLSYARQLRDQINELFQKAEEDISEKYDMLTARRVGSRAIGRASTASEYDLVDLRDLASKLSEEYPEQSKAIIDTIDKMVVKNATNAKSVSGLSLYYPFFNKTYYNEAWCQTYRELNIFSDYVNYLSKYEKIWLDDNKINSQTSLMPSMISSGQYALELSQEQMQQVASARYYILRKDGKEKYTKVYSSSNVENVKSRLIANYDGNIIYAHSKLNDYFIPYIVEHDTTDGVTSYSIPATLDNSIGSGLDNIDIEHSLIAEKCRFVISADKKSNNIQINSLMPNEVAKK